MRWSSDPIPTSGRATGGNRRQDARGIDPVILAVLRDHTTRNAPALRSLMPSERVKIALQRQRGV
jgi:hypothetical protein